MSNKLISSMGLPQHITNLFTARNLLTAKDVLSLPDLDLVAILDASLADVTAAVAIISELTCPPHQTVFSLMEERARNEPMGGHLSTSLVGLDRALCGGVPFGAVTELVGPAGVGKTQFCLKLSLLATLPTCYGGLNGRVLYYDTESKFSPRRMIEIGENSFPHIFRSEGMAQKMAGRIVVLRPTSLSELTESLQQMRLKLIQHEVKLIVIDSIAALVAGETEKSASGPRQRSIRWPIPFLKSLAEFSRIPVVVTNQIRGQKSSEAFQYQFQGNSKDSIENTEKLESHLAAALGIQWAHSVNIRLILEIYSGQRYIKIAKSPISPPVAFPFVVESSGISLVSDDGVQVMGQEINTIHCQGQSILDMAME